MQVPIMDLKRQYLSIKPEIDKEIQNTLNKCAFVAGSKVAEVVENIRGYYIESSEKNCSLDYND